MGDYCSLRTRIAKGEFASSARARRRKEKSNFMNMPNNHDDYELHDEYDLSNMQVVAKGRYAPHRRAGKNVVLLDAEMTRFFPSDAAVNEALRLIMQAADIPLRQGKESMV